MEQELRILMLEDNEGDAELNEEQLLEAGLSFRYHRVEKEQDYRHELMEFKPDLILADYRLPQFDGLAALRIAQEHYPFIPFIIVSGALGEEAAVELLKAGAADYILKQKRARLGSAVKNALELKRARLEKARVEAALRQSYRELEKRVEARTRELSQANQALRREIEERKRAEDALRDSEEKFRNLADNISQLAWMADETGYIFWYNKRWYEYTGTTLEEMQGRGWQKVHHPDYVQKVMEKINYSFKTGKYWEDTFPLRHRSGHYRWFLSRAIPIRNAEGQVIRWFGTHTDITELREAEAVLKRDKETLERLVRERTEELFASHRELDRARRLSDIGTLATTVAHELRSPLAAIGAANYNIRKKCPAMEKHTAAIEKKILDSNQIIDNLLFYTRIREPHPEEVRIMEILQEAVGYIKEKARQKDCKIREEYLALASVVLRVDPLQIAEVMHNILNNALDAVTALEHSLETREFSGQEFPGMDSFGAHNSESHGNQPTSTDPAPRPKKGQIDVLAAEKGDYVEIQVRDNGVGIRAADLSQVFEPFFSTKARGTGLGLTVSKQIIENHQGNLILESAAGGGTTVTIRLPRN